MIHFFLYFCDAIFTLGLDEEQTWAKLSLRVRRSDLYDRKKQIQPLRRRTVETFGTWTITNRRAT